MMVPDEKSEEHQRPPEDNGHQTNSCQDILKKQ